jgi:DNA-binding HxlR family transcriptional regulator
VKKALSPHQVTSGKPPELRERQEDAMPPPNAYAANCPTRLVLDRIADKWAVLVLGLLAGGPARFNAIRRAIEGVSQKMLSQTLKSLERDGLVHRKAIATVPVTVEYSITPLGRTLALTVDGLRVWAEANIAEVQTAQDRYDRSVHNS